MNLNHSFEIPTDQNAAWSILLDIPRIAPCMPGAELTEIVGERTYKGQARVKVGPVALKFAGQAEITDIDNDAHKAVVHAKGADGKGRGTADATVRFKLVAVGEKATRVDVDTDLNLTGAVAQYGRASGLIDAVANQIIADFVENLKGELASSGAAEVGPGAGDTVTGKTVAVDSKSGGSQAPHTPKLASPAKPVSGLSLLMRAIAAIIGGWFKRSDNTARTDRKK